MTRLVFEIPEDKMDIIKMLMGACNKTEIKAVFNTALTLLEWAVMECANGRQIASINEANKEYTVLNMAELNNAFLG